jgi:hypothetical protein
MSKLSASAAPILVFLLVFAIYVSSPVTQTDTDPRWSVHVAESIIREGNLDLDEYRSIIPAGDYRVLTFENHIYPYSPIGTSLLAVPFVYLYHIVESGAKVEQFYALAEVVIASLVTALTAAVLYLIARFSLDVKRSLLVSFIFAFCTSAWSTASRALLQHGPSMLALTLTLYLILLARKKPYVVQFAGIPLAYSYIIRPTNGISIILLTLFILWQYKRYSLLYLLWSAAVIVPFFLYNWSVYHSLLAPYYYSQRLGIHPRLVEALVGNWINPARGLFVFSPICLFSLYGTFCKIKGLSSDWRDGLLGCFLICAVLLHWIAISLFPHWYGGWSYGPRLFSDMVPYLIYLLMPVIPLVTHSKESSAPIRVAFACFIGISLFIHYRGATDNATQMWNALPVNVDVEPSRLWNWQDPPFLRGTPQLDALIPIKLTDVPDHINIWHDPDSTSDEHWEVDIYDKNYRDFQVSADIPGSESLIFVSNDNNAERKILSITLHTAEYTVGRHHLTMIISATRGNGLLAKKVTIPISLFVGQTHNRVFLPIITQAATAPRGPKENLAGGGTTEKQWAFSPATFFVSSPRLQLAYLEVTLDDIREPPSNTRFDKGILTLQAGQGISTSAKIAVGQAARLPLILTPGSQAITLTLKADQSDPLRPPYLDFAFRSIDLQTLDQAPTPPDLLVNGQPQQPADEQLVVIHGTGWYDLESGEATATRRWAKSPAALLVYSASPRPATLELLPALLHEPTSSNKLGDQGTMRITVNHDAPQQVAVQVGRLLDVDIVLRQGWNTIFLELATGNFHPTDAGMDDTRSLSFALSQADLLTR